MRFSLMTIMKQIPSIRAGLLVLAVLTHPLSAQTVFPTGTTIYNPAEAHSSYILISDHSAVGNHPSARVRAEAGGASPSDVRLIDMKGNVVHTWEVVPFFNKRSRLLPNGNLVYVGPNKTIYEYDWDGNVVWTHRASVLSTIFASCRTTTDC